MKTEERARVKRALETLLDVQVELEQPEVAELTTLALDRKIERAIKELKEIVGDE